MTTQKRHQYIVPGLKVVLNQLALKPPRPNGCWATVYTMMASWKRQQSLDVLDAIGRVGPLYKSIFETDQGLSQSNVVPFLRAAGMRYEPMANHDVKGWFQLLKQHGLLWVSGRATDLKGLHARIIEGIQIDELYKGHLASLKIIDPWGGKRYTELFSTFVKKYEGAFSDHSGSFFQIRHF